MKFLIVMLALIVAGAAHADSLALRPLPERNLTREAILERLVDAETTLASFDVPGCKDRLDRLSTDLAADASPFNQAVRKKAGEVSTALADSHLKDAAAKLHVLVQNVRDGVMPSFADLGDQAAM